VTSSIRNLSTTGRYVQVGNGTGSDLSNMYVSSFYPTSSPYYFATSAALNPLSKDNTVIVEGRGFDLNLGDAAFSYMFEDLNVDGKNIGFVDASDKLDYGKLENLNNALITMPFQVTENSKIVFSEKSGFADSLAGEKKLGKNGFINFKLDLIDAATGMVLAPVKTVNINSSNDYSVRTPSYLLNADGLTGKTVRMKISLESNLIEKLTSYLAVGDTANIPEHLKTRFNVQRSNLILTKSFKEENETTSKTTLNNLEVIDLDVPTTYALTQNYPNPFNPSTTISYQLPKDGMVTLKIFDMLGREVATLINNEQKTVGRYDVSFNANNLASGVYIYQLRVNDAVGEKGYTATKKLMLLK
ncbi:MAG: T9SS type A sorting domain-containing protein, partial [Ignavibacteriaceae bacterium]